MILLSDHQESEDMSGDPETESEDDCKEEEKTFGEAEAPQAGGVEIDPASV